MSSCLRILYALLLLSTSFTPTIARPLVRQIRSSHEFDRLIEKHAKETGLPVIADFYSDGCGPCRQIAPVFQQLAKETGQENAVFVKINTQGVPDLSSRYGIRSIPTFIFFQDGKKFDTLNGASGQALQQKISQVVNKSKRDNVLLTEETLEAYYKDVDPSKSKEEVDTVLKKCSDMNLKHNPMKQCFGAAALNLSKGLKKKYNKRVDTTVRFTAEDRHPTEAKKKENGGESESGTPSASSGPKTPRGSDPNASKKRAPNLDR
jgi:thioredoxin